MKSEKGLSSFGDVLLNFAYSCALSKIQGNWKGKRVQNSVLSGALSLSHLQKPRRSDRQTQGNFVESFIAKAWIEGVVTTEECINTLSENLKGEDKKSQIVAFKNLIDFVCERYKDDNKTPDKDLGH